MRGGQERHFSVPARASSISLYLLNSPTMRELEHKHILLGVTGGIAAYKSPGLVRRLRDAGAEVRVVLTPGAGEFVTALTFQATSGNPVHKVLLDETAEAGMGHIELARWADIILIAPATANSLAVLAHGFADDLLGTVCIASDAPLFIAPAMNAVMWKNSAVQDNLDVLRKRGVVILGPGEGDQACGETGAGRMLEPIELRDALIRHLQPPRSRSLDNVRVLLTAGPTREALDPVRYLSNHSSGKMGFALAGAAQRSGAKVTLIAGPVQRESPDEVERIDVTSAREMHAAVLDRIAEADVFIGVAAVADYRASQVQPEKIKKSSPRLSIELERNPDILADVASLKNKPYTVGFAAETENVERHAVEKLRSKNLDMIAANRVGVEGSGFASDDNSLTVLTRDGEKHSLANAPKARIAELLVELIAQRYKISKDNP